jgi:hypothetical protein
VTKTQEKQGKTRKNKGQPGEIVWKDVVGYELVEGSEGG